MPSIDWRDLITVGSVILFLVQWVKTRRFKRLEYHRTTHPLLGEKTTAVPGFKATFEGNTLQQLTAVRITVANTGTQTVHGTDFASAPPPRFFLNIDPEDAGRILRSEVLSQSRHACHVVAGEEYQDYRFVPIAFEFLGRHDHFTVSIIHSGPPDATVLFQGILKEGMGPTELSSDLTPLLSKPPLRMGLWVLTVVGALLLATFAYPGELVTSELRRPLLWAYAIGSSIFPLVVGWKAQRLRRFFRQIRQ